MFLVIRLRSTLWFTEAEQTTFWMLTIAFVWVMGMQDLKVDVVYRWGRDGPDSSSGHVALHPHMSRWLKSATGSTVPEKSLGVQKESEKREG
jgi:hypothetical protein